LPQAALARQPAISMERIMYTKPTLQQFGSFRNLTQLGFDTNGDGGIWGVVDGCDISGCNRS
jgi:hypothetical protein